MALIWPNGTRLPRGAPGPAAHTETAKNVNYVRTALLLAALTALFLGAGWLLAGQARMLMALAAAAAINLPACWNSGQAVLRYYPARTLDSRTHPAHSAPVAPLARQARQPMPRHFPIVQHTPPPSPPPTR